MGTGKPVMTSRAVMAMCADMGYLGSRYDGAHVHTYPTRIKFIGLQFRYRSFPFIIYLHRMFSTQKCPPCAGENGVSNISYPATTMPRLRMLKPIFKLFTDGASRGNPGKSGIGAALFSNDNILQSTLSSSLGHHTNNVAEYQACLHGLRMARSLHVPRLIVLSDSQLMVRHLQGTFIVRHPQLKRLYHRVVELAATFSFCHFVYVPRKENQFADRLANYALDTEARNHFQLLQPYISLAVFPSPEMDHLNCSKSLHHEEVATSSSVHGRSLNSFNL